MLYKKESFICNLKNCHPKTKSSKLHMPIQSDAPLPPNPNCPICSRAQVNLKINMKEATLKDFVDIVIFMLYLIKSNLISWWCRFARGDLIWKCHQSTLAITFMKKVMI